MMKESVLVTGQTSSVNMEDIYISPSK